MMIDGKVEIPPFVMAMTNGLAAAPGAELLIAFKRRGSLEETHVLTKKMART